MTGFKAGGQVHDLHFEDEKWDGLEVRARSITIGRLLAVTRLASRIGAAPSKKARGRGETDAETAVEQLNALSELLDVLGSALESWNVVDDDDEPVACDRAGLNDLETELVMAIVEAWVSAVAGVDAPLERSSTGGDRSVEVSIPMEPWSENRAS